MNDATAPRFSTARHLAAWGVHLYTGLGIPLAILSVLALRDGDAARYFILIVIACAVDSTDGAMARAVRVRDVLPDFDGRKLDDIIDFLHFAFIPGLALPALGLLPAGWEWVAVVMVMSSGYGFCQDRAKTDDAFVGFPSYWNIVVVYLYALKSSHAFNVAWILFWSVMVFVPIHYLYPTKTKLWRPFTLAFGAVWGVASLFVCAAPDAAWARPLAWVTLTYPVYYLVLSLVHHVQVHRRLAAAAGSAPPPGPTP